MATREGMTAPISRLRFLGDCATDDLFNDVTYWTDEQLQDILDMNTVQSQRIKLVEDLRYTDGSLDWKVQRFKLPVNYDMERTAIVVDQYGYTVSDTLYTLNYLTQVVTFTTLPTRGTYYLECNQIDMYEAVADVWDKKASQRTNYIVIKGGNNRFEHSQEYEHCVDMAKHYRNKKIRRFDIRKNNA